MAPHPIPAGAVQQALEQMLFGRFTVRERIVSVATTSTILFKNNPERIGYTIVNTGNIQLTFALSQDIAVAKGLILAQLGDTLSTTYVEDGQFPTHELSSIAAAAGGEVFIIEFIRYNL